MADERQILTATINKDGDIKIKCPKCELDKVGFTKKAKKDLKKGWTCPNCKTEFATKIVDLDNRSLFTKMMDKLDDITS